LRRWSDDQLTTNKFSPEVRDRAVRMVLDHEREHPSRWAAIISIAAKVGCTGQTLNEWLKKAERDNGRAPGVTTEMVKVFGCRPSQVWRQGMGPAYGNRPCTNPRGCGDGLWGFEVLLCCGDGETGSVLASAGTC
jgi:hypothetical protein